MGLVAVSNRLPLQYARGSWQPSAGGLVAALRPALEASGGSWVGWDGGHPVPPRVSGIDIDLHGVALSRREVDDYYHGFANRTLWPLLHGLVEQPVFEQRWWRVYQHVNRRFAHAVPDDADTVWIHDYHLLAAPAGVRERLPHARIGVFLHIPWCAPDIFARLPWRTQLLDAMLAADAVSFHTEEYRTDFVRSVLRLVDGARVQGRMLVTPDGRRVTTHAHPISIDASRLAADAVGPAAERCYQSIRRQFAGRRVLLGVDRLDYTKGIVERLRGFELLLEQQPALRGRVALVQIAVPSRGEIREYRRLRDEVEQLVGRINGRFTEPGRDVPIHYLYRGVPYERLLAYYRVADVCVVTPLRDGMNLVAKEFVVAQHAGGHAGMLVLSEFTGAAKELREAVICNPFDVEHIAGSLSIALELPVEERRRRLRAMSSRTTRDDVYRWVDRELGVLRGRGAATVAAGADRRLAG